MEAKQPDHPGVPVPPPLVFLAGLALGLCLHWVLDLGEPRAWIRVAGAAVGLGGFVYFVSDSLRRFRHAGTDPLPWRPDQALVTDGPYRITRNPMYVGMAFLFVGVSFAAGALMALAVLPVVLVVIDRVVIAREESYLEYIFGQEYVDYKGDVRRWL